MEIYFSEVKMKNNNNFDEELKSKIKTSYENNSYLTQYRDKKVLDFEKNIFEQIIRLIPKNAKILDLGCGNGYPYDYYFSERGYDLLGIDFCKKHLELAKILNSKARYEYFDIEKFEFNTKFDFVIALFSLIHIPRKSHFEIYRKIYNSLSNQGIFLLTLRDEDSGEIKYKDDFCGKEMYWSYYDYDTELKALTSLGFKLVYVVNQKDFGVEESQNWLILQKDKKE